MKLTKEQQDEIVKDFTDNRAPHGIYETQDALERLTGEIFTPGDGKFVRGEACRNVLRKWAGVAGDKAAPTRTVAELNQAWQAGSVAIFGATAPVAEPVAAPASSDGPSNEHLGRLLKEALGATGPDIDPEEVERIATAVAEEVAGKVAEELRAETKEVAEIVAKVKAGDSKINAQIAKTVAATSNPVLERFARYYPSSGECVRVALSSPPSFGKSRAAAQLGKSYDVFIEHNCGPVPEEFELLCGSIQPGSDGKFHPVDGPLAKAVRAAASGKRVLLFLDELWRLHKTAEDKVLAFLEPQGPDYVLRTNRVTSDGSFEELRAPLANLHILGAGNLNGKIPQEAFFSRWKHVRVDYDEKLAVTIAEQILDGYGVAKNAGGKLAEVFANALTCARKAVVDGSITYAFDFRSLVNACKIAATTEETEVAKEVKDDLRDRCSAWCPDAGDTVKESADVVAAIGKLFDTVRP